jgi:hypothetical protein
MYDDDFDNRRYFNKDYKRINAHGDENDWFIKKTKFKNLKQLEASCTKIINWSKRKIVTLKTEFFKELGDIRRFHGKDEEGQMESVYYALYGDMNYSQSIYIPKSNNKEYLESRMVDEDDEDLGPLNQELFDKYDSTKKKCLKYQHMVGMIMRTLDNAIDAKLQKEIEHWKLYQCDFEATLILNKRNYIVHNNGKGVKVTYPEQVMDLNKLFRVSKT